MSKKSVIYPNAGASNALVGGIVFEPAQIKEKFGTIRFYYGYTDARLRWSSWNMFRRKEEQLHQLMKNDIVEKDCSGV